MILDVENESPKSNYYIHTSSTEDGTQDTTRPMRGPLPVLHTGSMGYETPQHTAVAFKFVFEYHCSVVG